MVSRRSDASSGRETRFLQRRISPVVTNNSGPTAPSRIVKPSRTACRVLGELQIGDVRTALARPHIRIRNGAAKGGRSRVVPLWWDAGTLEDLAAWKADRLRLGAEPDEPFLASLIPGRAVKSFSRHTLRKRFRTACKILGAARLETLTNHHGRHTSISHAFAGGRTLAEVRDAAGHANVSITSAYLHFAADDDSRVGNLFDQTAVAQSAACLPHRERHPVPAIHRGR